MYNLVITITYFKEFYEIKINYCTCCFKVRTRFSENRVQFILVKRCKKLLHKHCLKM